MDIAVRAMRKNNTSAGKEVAEKVGKIPEAKESV